MPKIQAKQLVECFRRYCAEHWGYVWGLNGELYTQAKANEYKATQRSTSKWRNPRTYWTEDCKRWIGRMAADCSGGIVSAIREFDKKYSDRNANTFYNQCSEKGPIKTIPEIPGLCVWRDGHIGIYEGAGFVIEFRGTEYGCVRTKLSERNFTNWGKLRDVDYSDIPQKETPKTATYKVDDIVLFTSGAVFSSSNAVTPAHNRGKSRCKVTKTYNGKHPYHLISEDGGRVYGWVNASDIASYEQ